MNKILILLLFFSLSSCHSQNLSKNRDQAITQLIDDFCNLPCCENLILLGVNATLNHETDKYRLLSISLETEETITNIERARELIVTTISSFLAFANSQQQALQYLNIPVTLENIRLNIMCKDPLPGNIADMFNSDQMLYYYKRREVNAFPNRPAWTEIHKETFDQAKNDLALKAI